MAGTPTSASPAEISSLLAGPAGKPPPGVVPNFVDPYTLNPYIWLSIALWISISTLAIILRLVTDLVIDGRLVPDDYVMILGWVAQVGEVACGILVAKVGFGAHIWDIRLYDLTRALYYANLNSIVYGFVVALIKTAILMQYLRIFVPRRGQNKFLLYGCWFWLVVINIFYLVDTILEIVQCLPREKIWNPFFVGGSCIDYVSLYKATGIFNIISDFALLVLPLPTIISLHCDWKKKLQIGGVFAAGFLGCIASIFRTVYTYKLVQATDLSFYTWYVAFWTYAEITVGTLVFCLPGVPRFLNLAKDRIHSISSRYLLSRRRGSRGSGSLERDVEGLPHGQEPQHPQQAQEEAPVKKGTKGFEHMFVSYESWEDPNAYQPQSMNGIAKFSTSTHDVELQTLGATHTKGTHSPLD